MARLLYRLGLASAHHRLAVILVWLAVLVVSGIGAATLSGSTDNSFEIPGQESTTALDLMEDRFGDATSGATAQVVLQPNVPGGTITSPENSAKVNGVVDRLKTIPAVAMVTNPLDPASPTVSPDQSTAYIGVTFLEKAPELSADQHQGLDDSLELARDAGLTAEMTGDATQETETSAAEGIGVAVALLILLVTFGSLVVAGMNLLTALVGVGVGLLGLTTLTGFVDLSSTTPALASMLGLAVGIDYALFIVTRFRQQLLAGDDVRHAAAMAVGTAGSAVVTAGLTVVIALAGLTVVGIPFLGQMGLAAAGTVVIAVLVAVTLVPAALAYLGRRALRKAQRNTHEVTAHEPPAVYSRWATLVTKRSALVLIGAIVMLGVISIPFASMKTALTTRGPEGSTQQKATEILNEKFGAGSSGPLIVLIDGAGASDKAARVAQEVGALPGVVAAAQSATLPDGTAALVSVVPRSAPESPETVTIVKEVRERLATDEGPRAYVTGTTAIGVDVSQKLNDALPIYLAIVVGLAFILLILVFRSVLVPLVGVLGFLLTIGAAFGSMVAVFQWGWLADVFSPGTPGPILSFAPVIIIGILFGLAMDYQVFLVSRMHEAFAHGSAPKDAIVSGFKNSAPVVLAAAAIMFGVFSGFISGEPTIKLIGFTLAVGILFDAIIVRMLAVPAAIALIGKTAWAFPRWLEWLPSLDVEGQALERRSPNS